MLSKYSDKQKKRAAAERRRTERERWRLVRDAENRLKEKLSG